MRLNTRTIVKDVKSADKCRDFTWINRQYEKGRLTVGGGYTMTAAKFEEFRIAIRSTNEVYEGLWDLSISANVNTSTSKVMFDVGGIDIHFPEVTITNGRSGDRNTHIIKDLFVKVVLDGGGESLRVGELQGGRTTMTKAEISSEYLHSHLRKYTFSSGDSLPYWGRFCTGSGHINIIRSDINGDGFNEEKFTNYLVQIMGLVTWESIEGTPYNYIAEIRIRARNGTMYTASDTKAKNLKRKVIAYHAGNNITPQVTIALDNHKYVIRNDEALENFLMNTRDWSEAENKEYFCEKTSEDAYYKVGSTPGPISTPRITSNFLFQGRIIPFIVSDDTEEAEVTTERVVHPRIKHQIIKELEHDINTKKIRKSTIDRYQG